MCGNETADSSRDGVNLFPTYLHKGIPDTYTKNEWQLKTEGIYAFPIDTYYGNSGFWLND